MQASCAQIIGLVLLVNTNLAIIIGFATPYWVEFNYPALYQYNRGLWAKCDNSDCDWMFDNDFRLQRALPAWFQATQALMAVGLTCGLVALLVATLSLCCTCHSCNPNHTVAGCLVVACLTMAVGIAIFGIKAADEWNLKMDWDYVTNGRFGWSFWVAVGATVAALFTSIVYGCMGRKYQA